MNVSDLKPTEYDQEHTGPYLRLVPEGDLFELFASTKDQIVELIRSLPPEKHEYQYAPGKWTVKEMLQHMIDAERIFAYRALRFAREDPTPLSGFEQDDYVPPSQANARPIEDLLEEYQLTRASTMLMFKGFTDRAMEQRGEASGAVISARAFGFKIIGHDLHHLKVLRERYV